MSLPIEYYVPFPTMPNSRIIPAIPGAIKTVFFGRDGRCFIRKTETKEKAASSRFFRKIGYNLRENPALVSDFQHSIFVTLTYDKENYPPVGEPYDFGGDFREFMNRMRCMEVKGKKLDSMKDVRYFAVLEQGSENARVHFHLCLSARFVGIEFLYRAWQKGHIDIKAVHGRTVRLSSGGTQFQTGSEGALTYMVKYMVKGAPVGIECLEVGAHMREIAGRRHFMSRGFTTPPKGDCFPIRFIPAYIREVVGKAQMVNLSVDQEVGLHNARIEEGGDYLHVIKALKRWFSGYMEKKWNQARDRVHHQWARALYQNSFYVENFEENLNECFQRALELGLSGLDKLCFRKVLRDMWFSENPCRITDFLSDGAMPQLIE